MISLGVLGLSQAFRNHKNFAVSKLLHTSSAHRNGRKLQEFLMCQDELDKFQSIKFIWCSEFSRGGGDFV